MNFRKIPATLRGVIVTAAVLTVTACAPQFGANTPLNALGQLTELKEEVKRLRNAVEELQFSAETDKRRQQNLFQDLDRRLLSLERSQRLLLPNDVALDGEVADAQETDPALLVEAAVGDGIPSTATTTPATSSTTAAAKPVTKAKPVEDEKPVPAVSVAEQQAYEKAFNFLKQSRYNDAIVAFQKLVNTWPKSQLADDAYYWMSEARYVNREFEAALVGFRIVVTRYTDSVRVPEAMLKIGYIRYDIGSYDKAADIFRDILERFPGHQVAVSAETRLRRIEQTIQQ